MDRLIRLIHPFHLTSLARTTTDLTGGELGVRSVRMRMIIVGLVLCGWATVSQAQPIPLRTTVYGSGFSLPVAFVQDPSDNRIQYVVEQAGRIRVVQSGWCSPRTC